jgi:chromosome segregation ATPase
MSEAEQAINVSEWKELHAELEEVSDKRNRLQTENNRPKTLMQLTQKECDEAKNELLKMTAERDHATAQWEECCEDRGRQVAALREQLAEMTASRDNFERLCKEWRIEFDAINAKKDGLQVELSQWQVGHDVMKEQLQQMVAERDAVKEANGSQFRMVQALQRDVSQLQAEQEAAHKTAASAYQDFLQMVAERDAARKFADKLQVDLGYCRCEHDAVKEELARVKENADMFEAENKYLQDTVRQLRSKQIHDDLPGLLKAIQAAAEQARELI